MHTQFKIEVYRPIYQGIDLIMVFLYRGGGSGRMPWPAARCER
jgi:hypothetical protein